VIDGLSQLAHLQTINGEPQFVIQCLDALCVQFFRPMPEPTQSFAAATVESARSTITSNCATPLLISCPTASTPSDRNNHQSTGRSSSNHNRLAQQSSQSNGSRNDADRNSLASTGSSRSSGEFGRTSIPISIAASPSPPPPSLSSLPSDSTFMLLLRRKGPHSLRLYVQELNANPMIRPALNRSETIRFDSVATSGRLSLDFVLFAVPAPRAGLLYLLSKHGQLIVCDLHSGTQLISQQPPISHQPLIAARLDVQSQGVVCVSRDGRVLLLEPDLLLLSSYLCQHSSTTRMAAVGARLKKLVNAAAHDEVTRL
jgi:hypothetical protein